MDKHNARELTLFNSGILQQLLSEAKVQTEELKEQTLLLLGIKLVLDVIAVNTKPKPSIVGLRVVFGKTNLKGVTDMSSVGTFNSPDADSVPYTIEAVDANGAAVNLSAGDVVALVSTDGNSVIVPSSADPTGATGVLKAKKGFAGAVSGTATFTPAGATAPTLNGVWSGTFIPGQAASLAVAFGTPVV